MKKDGKYRFTLQFPAVTEEQIAVGELLESLGNRKSALVVAAVLHFAHAQQSKLSSATIHTITRSSCQSGCAQIDCS